METKTNIPLFRKLGFTYADQRLSSLTGMIHSHQNPFMDSWQTICIEDNFCYVLALFHEKQSEPILQAEELLTRLLAFQTPIGGFPKYIHEYPIASGYYEQFWILYVLVCLEMDYAKVIPKELRKKILFSIEKLSNYLRNSDHVMYQFFQSIYHKKRISIHIEYGDYTVRQLSSILPWLLKADPHLAYELLQVYDLSLMSFTGLCKDLLQIEGRPVVHLLDLFFYYQLEKESACTLKPSRQHLKFACLHPPMIPEIQNATVTSFHVGYGKNIKTKKDHLIRFQYLSNDKLCSFVCQDDLDLQVENNAWIFSFSEKFTLDKKDLYELNFYTEKGKTILVNQQKATNFLFKDTLSIETKDTTLKLRFELLQGEGKFWGHIQFANRPAELDKDPFQVYDHRICLRTIDRSNKVKIKVSWEFLEKGMGVNIAATP